MFYFARDLKRIWYFWEVSPKKDSALIEAPEHIRNGTNSMKKRSQLLKFPYSLQLQDWCHMSSH